MDIVFRFVFVRFLNRAFESFGPKFKIASNWLDRHQVSCIIVSQPIYFIALCRDIAFRINFTVMASKIADRATNRMKWTVSREWVEQFSSIFYDFFSFHIYNLVDFFPQLSFALSFVLIILFSYFFPIRSICIILRLHIYSHNFLSIPEKHMSYFLKCIVSRRTPVHFLQLFEGYGGKRENNFKVLALNRDILSPNLFFSNLSLNFDKLFDKSQKFFEKNIFC